MHESYYVIFLTGNLSTENSLLNRFHSFHCIQCTFFIYSRSSLSCDKISLRLRSLKHGWRLTCDWFEARTQLKLFKKIKFISIISYFTISLSISSLRNFAWIIIGLGKNQWPNSSNKSYKLISNGLTLIHVGWIWRMFFLLHIFLSIMIDLFTFINIQINHISMLYLWKGT